MMATESASPLNCYGQYSMLDNFILPETRKKIIKASNFSNLNTLVRMKINLKSKNQQDWVVTLTMEKCLHLREQFAKP
jgi:hypothetical protein